LTSKPFIATQPWASFLVGGGSNPAQARVELVLADTGTVFHTASGRDVEDMSREIVDLRPVQGQRLFIRLTDDGTGGWGHVNFDDFVFHAKAPERDPVDDRQRTSPVLWHLRPNPAAPARVGSEDARRAIAGMKVTHGFQAELIASEPDVVQPIAFAIDGRGRLWVLEGLSYPNKQPEGQGRDRVVILADENGDGEFEKRTVFAEGLNLASGIEVGFGGVWVGAAPELLFIPDRNGDDRPDGPAEVVLDGWGFQDTHETLNSFLWGPDGWLYGDQGVFTHSSVGRPGTPEVERVALRSGVWRYHPVRRVFEVFASGGSNQWGLDYNEAGHLFMTHCRSYFGGGGTTHVIRNGHFWNQTNANYAPFISAEGPDFAPGLKNYLPASARYDSGEGGAGKPGTTAVYGGHSHVGTLIYQGENFPAIYRDHLFTHNLHGHQINHQVNVRQGSGYETMHAGSDLAYTPDPRSIPVDLQTGPDGAVYCIDWVDQQHCHTPIEEKWDRSNGRVYRLSWAATYQPVRIDLRGESDLSLARLQTSRNDWMARTARRLLQERAATSPIEADAVGVLRGLAGSSDWHPALRGLWSLHLTNNLETSILESAVRHHDDRVRAWAVQLATEVPGKPRLPEAVLTALARSDSSPTVRLALASALPALSDGAVWQIATELAGRAEDAGDRFLPKMTYAGLAPHVPQDFPRALALAAGTKQRVLADSIVWLAATSAAGREALVRWANDNPEQAGHVVRIAAFALRSEASLPAPGQWSQMRARAADSSDPAVRADADQLAAVFGDGAVLERMRRTLADGGRPAAERKAAFALLRRTGDPAALPFFARLLDDPDFRSVVIPLLARSNDPATAEALLQRLASFTEADRAAALTTLSSQAALARVLLQAAETGTIDKKQLTALHLRQIRTLNDPVCTALLENNWGRFNDTPAATRETIARIRKTFGEAPLWAYETAHGRAVFDRVCGTCHALGGSSAGKLGPDLAGTWRNGADYFIENIVDPNAVIGDAFQLSIVTLKDGTVVSGAVEAETATALSIRSLTGAVVAVPTADVAGRQKLEQSLMPPGLLESLPERDMIALLKFLTTGS
jgi:putative membrane-bound dehydrogenase-like protein